MPDSKVVKYNLIEDSAGMRFQYSVDGGAKWWNIPMTREQFNEAMALHQEHLVPMADYLVQLVPIEHMPDFGPDV